LIKLTGEKTMQLQNFEITNAMWAERAMLVESSQQNAQLITELQDENSHINEALHHLSAAETYFRYYFAADDPYAKQQLARLAAEKQSLQTRWHHNNHEITCCDSAQKQIWVLLSDELPAGPLSTSVIYQQQLYLSQVSLTDPAALQSYLLALTRPWYNYHGATESQLKTERGNLAAQYQASENDHQAALLACQQIEQNLGSDGDLNRLFSNIPLAYTHQIANWSTLITLYNEHRTTLQQSITVNEPEQWQAARRHWLREHVQHMLQSLTPALIAQEQNLAQLKVAAAWLDYTWHSAERLGSAAQQDLMQFNGQPAANSPLTPVAQPEVDVATTAAAISEHTEVKANDFPEVAGDLKRTSKPQPIASSSYATTAAALAPAALHTGVRASSPVVHNHNNAHQHLSQTPSSRPAISATYIPMPTYSPPPDYAGHKHLERIELSDFRSPQGG
jgi:hypothetical protein